MFDRAELTKIANLCKKHNVLCISDEVYEWMVYDGNEHVRICKFLSYEYLKTVSYFFTKIFRHFARYVGTHYHNWIGRQNFLGNWMEDGMGIWTCESPIQSANGASKFTIHVRHTHTGNFC